MSAVGDAVGSGFLNARGRAIALLAAAVGLLGLWTLAVPGSAAAVSGCVQSGANVIVPAGATCTLASGTTVAGDVMVQQGGTLVDNGASISHDVQADHPAGIGIQGGSIGHDVQINGLSGQGPRPGGDSYICAASIGHDLQVQNGAPAAGALVIGDAPDCTGTTTLNSISPGNSIGHDLQVQNNANPVDVSNSTVSHDMQVQNNTGGSTISSNSAGHNTQCQNDTQPVNGGGNTARGQNQGCPTTGITGITEFVCNPTAGTELRAVSGAGFLPDTQITFTVSIDGTPNWAGDLNDPPFVFTDATGAFNSTGPPFAGFTLPTGRQVTLQITATDGVTTSSYDRTILALCSS